MASVRRVHNSPFWIAKYRDGSTIRYRSTKQKGKSNALRVALAWEEHSTLASRGELTQAAVLKGFNELLEKLGQPQVGKESLVDFAARWLNSGIKAKGTRQRYKAVIDGLVTYLGAMRSQAPIGSITAQEIEKFRDAELTQGKTASTADFSLKVIRILMEHAKRQNQRLDNPADAVLRLQVVQQERKPFTDEQLQKVLTAADTEWKGMVLFGAFAGIRLNDAANLTWAQVDLATESLTFVPAKTARSKPKPLHIALHPVIIQYLKSLPVPLVKTKPIFPSLVGKTSGSAGGLSNRFATLLTEVGLRSLETKDPKSETKSKTRKFNELGFHSTRHYFISMLANADVPPDVRKAMAGHSADSAHAKYVHLELATQKRALAKLEGLSLQKIPA